MDWFEKRAKELKEKEIESFHKEILDKENSYYNEIRNAGFDNAHDYENWLMGKFLLRVLFTLLVVIASFVWWFI